MNKMYLGYIIDKSQRDKNIFSQLTISNQKKVWLGFITIYEIKVNADDINSLIRKLQENMVTHIAFVKQEFYVHFYCENELIVVFKEKVFHITTDKITWTEAIAYGRSLGIREKQLDFLSPEENKRRYFNVVGEVSKN